MIFAHLDFFPRGNCESPLLGSNRGRIHIWSADVQKLVATMFNSCLEVHQQFALWFEKNRDWALSPHRHIVVLVNRWKFSTHLEIHLFCNFKKISLGWERILRKWDIFKS